MASHFKIMQNITIGPFFQVSQGLLAMIVSCSSQWQTLGNVGVRADTMYNSFVSFGRTTGKQQLLFLFASFSSFSPLAGGIVLCSWARHFTLDHSASLHMLQKPRSRLWLCEPSLWPDADFALKGYHELEEALGSDQLHEEVLYLNWAYSNNAL